MSIASELQNYADGLEDAYDAVNDMSGVIPQDRNLNNLDTAIRTIPQSTGPTYTAGNGIDITNDVISIDDTVVAELTDIPGVMIGATPSAPGVGGTVPAPAAGDDTKFLAGDGTWQTVSSGSTSTTFYSQLGVATSLYSDSAMQNAITAQQLLDALQAGEVWLEDSNSGNPHYLITSYDTLNNTGVRAVFLDEEVKKVHMLLYSGGMSDTTYTDSTIDYQGKLTAGSNIQINGTTISATDTTYSDFTGATSSVAGSNGLVPAPSAGDQEKVLHGDGTWKDTTAKLVEMSYGESNAWAKFIAAYNAGSIVYCRASSNANPGTGSQTRKAFMAYVNNATNPTNVEFQYVRSQSSKTDSQQCDQVFVYTLTNASGGTWSVASRNMGPKINVSGPITKTFTSGANATITIGADAMTGATSGAAGAAGIVPAPAAGDNTEFLRGDGTWATQEAPVITMTSTDPGEGGSLAADNYIFVYEAGA